ncbi:MAG: hypothetical protein R6X15_08640 [Pseudomonadota bacterium]
MNAVTQYEDDVRTAGVDYFNPDDYLLNTLRRAASNEQDILIEVDGIGTLLLLSSRGEYFPSVTDMAVFLTTAPEQCKLTILPQGDERIPSEDIIGRNIDELMWQAAFHASQGRMMRGCYRDDVVELEHWPNLSRLPHTPQAMRIAALLSNHPTSIFFAMRLLKVAPAEMYQFYSAARAAGLARPINRKPEEPKLEPHRNQTLLSALLGKIARI